VQDRVEVPEPPLIVVEDNAQDRDVELVPNARATAPVNPFSGATVIVDVPDTLTLTETLGELAVTVKVGALST
jgi:hypothetical protein